MLQNLLKDLESLLQKDQSFISDGAILKNAVIEAALNMDARLLELLMQSDTIKEHFFTDVVGALVFDKVKFQEFVSNKAFLPDSYTAFKNRIGLTDGHGDYLSQARDVVLAWPYKDCVLEGGMTKEDRGRNEVFWNATLAPDDITRLFEPKVLSGWERWDAEAAGAGKAKPVGEVSEDDNLLIKGNNLLALHSLKVRYEGKVKLIYIDPPFNTESDSFKYNDRFKRSSWLTFMKNRLEVANAMLHRTGTMMVHIDEKEMAHLRVLCDEVLGRDNFLNIFCIKTSDPSGHKTVNPSPYSQTEYILLYAKHKASYTYEAHFVPANYDSGYNKLILNPDAHFSDWEIGGLNEHVAQENGYKSTREANQKLGRHVFESLVANYAFEHRKSVFQATAIADDAAKSIVAVRDKSKAEPKKVFQAESDGGAVYVLNGRQVYFYANKVKEIDGHLTPAKPLTNLWSDIAYNGISNEGGVTLKNGKKPEKLLRRAIEISTQKGDLVVDFFAGSGTTAAVAHKLGRQWIAVEQLDYINSLTKNRFLNVIKGETSGISKIVGWQGGGSFVYAELAASNAAFVDRIEAAPDMIMLQAIHADIQSTGYLRYDVDLSAFDSDDFAALPLDDAKRVLMDCLDTNHLYVNLGSLGDAAFDISDEDARATRSFYGVDQ
ncbi:MAG: site-specific DNA-methyltransferase [Pseudomonas sp.]|nr:site-specific DNA-methyltransferase [Pseudomonas sp.]